MDPTGFFVIGGILVLVGVIVMLANIRNMQRRARIKATPTSKVAQASGVGHVEIAGAVVPGDNGVFSTPLGGKPAVWARVIVQELRRRGKSSTWVVIYKETYDRIFYVDDGSGERARVHTEGAMMVLDQAQVASSGFLRDPPPHVQQFLAQRGIASEGMVFNRTLRFTEELLAPGDSLYALGPSSREGGGQGGAFRQGPPGQLVLRAGNGFAHELILTNKPENTLVMKMLTGFLVGAVLAALGAAGVVAGLVV
jgi:hypothetical protein